MVFIIESTLVEPGTEKKLDVPIGTKNIFWCWQGEKQSVNEYTAYGAVGKGLTPDAAISDLVRLLKRRVG